jgi:hypothetical protein
VIDLSGGRARLGGVVAVVGGLAGIDRGDHRAPRFPERRR